MDLWIILGLLALIIGLGLIGYRSRKSRTLGSGTGIDRTIERPTRPFDKR